LIHLVSFSSSYIYPLSSVNPVSIEVKPVWDQTGLDLVYPWRVMRVSELIIINSIDEIPPVHRI
jgi:hypothetical protein